MCVGGVLLWRVPGVFACCVLHLSNKFTGTNYTLKNSFQILHVSVCEYVNESVCVYACMCVCVCTGVFVSTVDL